MCVCVCVCSLFHWFPHTEMKRRRGEQDVAKGERLLKDVYEAIRSSPQWNRTMFAVLCAARARVCADCCGSQH